jgi:orotidine-5'-phosphate decarboxylase
MPDGSGFPITKAIRDISTAMADRLIVALDVESVEEAYQLVQKLDGIISFFKIGFRLQITEGFDGLIKHLLDSNKQIFLDAKMFDIPETVETAVQAAARRGVSFITVHGDENILMAAARGRGHSNIKIFAVTVLTSLDDEALTAMGYAVTAKALVQLRAEKAIACKCDGIIASADDKPDAIRELAKTNSLLIATPGVRMPGVAPDDQKRTATPSQAIEYGADYLVVGRPIIKDADPANAARKFIAEMEEGQRRRDEANASR